MTYRLGDVADKIYDNSEQYTDQYVADYFNSQISLLLNKLYPIGSVYYNTKDVDPNQFLPGKWSKIEDRFLLSSGNTYQVGSVGGEAVHTLTVDETPAHTHTRGTMNITGTFNPYSEGSGVQEMVNSISGAFYGASTTSSGWGTSTGIDKDNYLLGFDASRSWTGATSSVGSSQSHNNMPPYLVVNVWQRIS